MGDRRSVRWVFLECRFWIFCSVIGTIEVTTRTSKRHGLRGRVFYEAVQRSQVERDFGCIP